MGRERPQGRAWGEEGGSEVGVAHAPFASDSGSDGGIGSATGGTERRPLTSAEVADCKRPARSPAFPCYRCQDRRIEGDLRATRGTVLPSFGSPTLFPTDRLRTAAKGGTQSRYNRYMKREAAEILKEALALPIEARAALAGLLLDSLDTDVDEDAETSWAIEVNRRVAELDSGAVKTVSWAEVRRRLAAR